MSPTEHYTHLGQIRDNAAVYACLITI